MSATSERAESGSMSRGSSSCEGEESAYVRLISSDSYEFFLKRETALQSPVIAKLLATASFGRNEVHLPYIPSRILVKVYHYLTFKAKYEKSDEKLQNFELNEDDSLEILIAANYLEL